MIIQHTFSILSIEHTEPGFRIYSTCRCQIQLTDRLARYCDICNFQSSGITFDNIIQTVSQRYNLITSSRNIKTCIPFECTVTQNIRRNRQLYTWVRHLSGVGCQDISRKTFRRSLWHIQNQVWRFRIEIIKINIDTIKYTCTETYVILFWRFPFQIRVGNLT